MSKGTLALLFLLVIVLCGLWVAKEREALRTAQGGGDTALAEYPLLPGLELERVASLRIDHLERSFQLAVERDRAGRWFMTDPVAYPAQSGLVRSLLESLAMARAEPAPEVALAAVGLEPPKVVLTIEQRGEGEPTRTRLELGALDLDPSRIYARVPGHPAGAAGGCEVFRTTRVLTNTLERSPEDYRERKATSLSAQDVVSLRRSGQVFQASEGRPVDLAFDALLGPDGWKRSAPTVSLDPSAMGLLARAATELTIERFVDDSPQEIGRFGLDPPSFTIAIDVLSGTDVELLFGHRATTSDVPVAELVWYCMRKGYAHVWEVRTRDVELLTQPAELFYDQLVVRALRADVARLELEGGGARRVLAVDGEGWKVWEGDEASAQATPGNRGAIEEALALLERVQLAEHLAGEAFEPTDPPSSFALVLENGARLGGALGRATRDPASGAQGRQFLRDGDEVVALIDDTVLELCLRPLEEFRSRKVHQLHESEVRMLELEAGGKSYAFVNDGDNQWTTRGQPIRAPDDFVQALDGLLNLGARRWLAAAPAESPELGVRVTPVQGEPWSFSFARAADGTHVYLGADGQAAEVDGALVERLMKLF
jgi:uncharacterized protein DUF4340